MRERAYPEWVRTKSQQRMHDDFRVFLWYVWRHLGLPEPTPIQYAIAYYLQHGPKRRIIQAFRGCGKSWITAAFVLWLLWRDPQHKILVVSASKERADAFSIFVKRLINDIDILQFLRPKAGQRDSNISFDVGPATPDQAPSVKSAGITGQITGSRANTIIADDVEIPENSATETQREKLSNKVKEFDAILKPGGDIVALGTPQIAESLYVELANTGYQTRIWPARYTDGLDKDGNDQYNGRLDATLLKELEDDPELAGASTEPSRFTDQDLAEREARGRSWFALQYMLNTSLSDAERFPLKISDLICMDLDKKIGPVQVTYGSGHQQVIEGIPNVGLNGDRLHRPLYISEAHVEYEGSFMAIDPSGRGKDECSYAVVKMLNGRLFLVGWGGVLGTGYSPETLKALALIAKEHQVNEIWTESNMGDGMFNALFDPVLTKHYPCTLDEYRSHVQKEARIIDTLEPVLNQHRLVIDRALAEENSQTDPSGSAVRSGLYQLSHLTRDRGSLKHDDRVDVLAAAVGYWVERLDVSDEDGEERHRERLKQEALEEFMKAAGKGTRRFKSYIPHMAR